MEFFLGYLSRFSAGAGDRIPVAKKDFSFWFVTPGEKRENINHHDYFWLSICVNHNVQSFQENVVQLRH